MERLIEKFSLPPARAKDLHRRLQHAGLQALCKRELRRVSQQLSLAYGRKQILLERSELADKLHGQHVEVYDFADSPLELCWKGHSLPYRVFSKDQRVSHTATVANKRLGHALTIVKAQQEIKRLPTVLTNSDEGGYKKRGRQFYGPDYVEDLPAPETVGMCEMAKSGDLTHSHSTTTTT